VAQFEILEEYVHSQKADIDQNKPVTVEIRDLDTFERLVAKVLIGSPESPLEDGDQLILKNLAENVTSDQWTVKVLEELDPDEVDITPQSDFRKSAPDGV
jgi:hypothetical protein